MTNTPWTISELVDCEIFSKKELSTMLECEVSAIEEASKNWYNEWELDRLFSQKQKDRLGYLGRLCQNLEGSYNNDGIKRWFRRRRQALHDSKIIDILCCIDYIPHLRTQKHRWPSEDLLEEIMELSMVHAECT